MTPSQLLTLSLRGAVLGVLILLLFVMGLTLWDIVTRRADGVPRRRMLRYYPQHLYHAVAWQKVLRTAPLFAAVTGLATAVVVIFTVGLLEVFA